MSIFKILVYYLGIQMFISTLLYFYYLTYWKEQCREGDDLTTQPKTEGRAVNKIMRIILFCAIIAVLYHSYLNVKYRH